MTKPAPKGVNLLFRPAFNDSKAEALLMDLRQRGKFTYDLFAESQPVAAEKVMGG